MYQNILVKKSTFRNKSNHQNLLLNKNRNRHPEFNNLKEVQKLIIILQGLIKSQNLNQYSQDTNKKMTEALKKVTLQYHLHQKRIVKAQK
jgi:NADPH-dependent curcumin reductase CurA